MTTRRHWIIEGAGGWLLRYKPRCFAPVTLATYKTRAKAEAALARILQQKNLNGDS